MAVDDLKIAELRATFDRENSRKESLENKASYFIGVISIIVTIICANSSFLGPIEKYYSPLGIILIIILTISFLASIGSCLYMFFPKNYAHPFILNDFDKFEESFEVENKEFEEDLIDSYITSIKTNHDLNNGLVGILNIAKFSFIIFFVALVIILVIL